MYNLQRPPSGGLCFRREHLIDRRYDISFFNLLADSYLKLIGQPLVPEEISSDRAVQWLYEDAPFGLLAHNTAPDPIFIYGNKTAQKCFEYTWEELTALPSRLSAEPAEQSERQHFLERVEKDGYVTGYRGIRITKYGKRFWIEDATVWDLTDESGKFCGQAALLPVVEDVQNAAPGAKVQS